MTVSEAAAITRSRTATVALRTEPACEECRKLWAPGKESFAVCRAFACLDCAQRCVDAIREVEP